MPATYLRVTFTEDFIGKTANTDRVICCPNRVGTTYSLLNMAKIIDKYNKQIIIILILRSPSTIVIALPTHNMYSSALFLSIFAS